MKRHFRICIALAVFRQPFLCLAQEPPDITIAVYNYADVPDENLAKAEAEARRIFRNAGVQTTWMNCSRKLELEKIESASCLIADNTHLVLKILQRAKNGQVGKRIDVLGSALLLEDSTTYYGYAYAYYDRIQQLTESRKLGYGLLAAVLVHEIGHLLLQSNSHSLIGIMRARWTGEELGQISKGIIYFTPTESRLMRARLEQLRTRTTRGSPLSSLMQ